MNRVQFMEQLKKLLSDISEEERQEALEYYESYFDDAGEDQEAEVIRELGSPGKVAAIIKEETTENLPKMDFRMSVQIMNVRCHRTVWTEVIMLNAKAERPV